MAQAAPLLRDDLLISKHETQDETFFVVKDPATRRFFRFREAEYCVARHLDGATPLDAVRQRVAAELGAEPEPGVLEAFVAQLRRQGLLAEGDGRPARPASKFFGGTAVWLRLKAFDPDRLFNWLQPRIGFFFTPTFVTLAIAVIATGIATVLANRADLGPDFRRLWGAHGLVMIWAAIFAVTVLHEFAHGLTCKHFGGEVHELGFLLIYGSPAFYCNVSDSWLFPERAKRLWVMAAGGFFELFVWGLAAILWRITEPGTWLGSAALVIVLTSGVRQFFNLNPLIKLDGYYLLSDLLEVPNLRPRAFRYMQARLLRPFGFGPADVEQPTRRERIIFVAYGLVAMAFSYWLLSEFAVYLFRSLTGHYQGWGFLMFAAILNFLLGNPLQRAWTRAFAPLSARLGAVSRRLLMLLALATAAAVLAVLPIELTAGGALTILAEQNADLRAQVEGVMDSIYVDEGSFVRTGDTIARLAAREDAASLHRVEGEIGARQAELALLGAGPRRREVEMAQSAVQNAVTQLRYAVTQAQRTRTLAAQHAATGAELDSAEQEVATRTHERDAAQARLDLLVAGTRPESLTVVREQIASLEAERRRLADRLGRVAIVAPHPGIVTTPHLKERLGDYLKPGDVLAKVLNLDTAKAEITVPEREIGDVRLGQRGSLRLRAYPERAFDGRVINIAPAVEQTPAGEGIVRVTIAIPNDSGLIKAGMSGFARISCGKRPALDVLTRRFRRFLRVEFWSWW